MTTTTNPTIAAAVVLAVTLVSLAPNMASGNSPPVISDFLLSTYNVFPIAGGTSEVGLDFMVTDVDGVADIATIDYFLVSPTGPLVSLSLISETTDVIDAYTLRFSVTFGMQFYYVPGEYRIQADVFDDVGTMGSGFGDFSYGTLLGLDILESNIEFGPVALGQTSPAIPITVQNAGNIGIDISILGTDLADGEGNLIPISNLEFGATEFGVFKPVDSTPTFKNLDLLPGPLSLAPLYLRVTIPQATPAGTYQGSVSIFAIDSTLGFGPDPTLLFTVTVDEVFKDGFEGN